jgi:hypothetical protein
VISRDGEDGRRIGVERLVELAVIVVLFAVEIDHVADVEQKGRRRSCGVVRHQVRHLDLAGKFILARSAAVADDIESDARSGSAADIARRRGADDRRQIHAWINMRRRHDAASLPQALRLHERGLVGVRVVIGNVLAGRIVRIEVGEHIAFCVRRAGRFCAGQGRSGGRCRRAGRHRTCPRLVLGARLRIATACGHRSVPAWKRRHDCSADRVRGFVDFLDFRDGRIAFFVGACRLRLELDEKTFGAGGEQKDNSAILFGAIFDVVRLAVEEV